MKLSIYVPTIRAEEWASWPGFITWTQFLRGLTHVAGGVTVTQGTGIWKGSAGIVNEPVNVVEVFIPLRDTVTTHKKDYRTWQLFQQYAQQLIRQGEESVLLVRDGEPSLIR